MIRYEDYANKNYFQDLRIMTYKDTISKNKFTEIIVWAKYNNSSYNEFEYDKKGNWIEKKHIGQRGKLSTVFRREIEYYE